MSRDTRNTSFAERMSYNVVFVTSILFVVIVAFASICSHILIAKEAKKSAVHLLESSTNKIEIHLKEVEDVVKAYSWVVKENLDDPEYLYQICTEIVSSSTTIVGSAIAFVPDYYPGKYYFSPYAYSDNEGVVHTKQLGNESYDYFYMDWFQIPSLLGRSSWSEPYYDEGGSNIGISTYSYPIFDDDGKMIAIITADIAMSWLKAIINNIRPYESSYTLLVSRAGAYIDAEKFGNKIGETIFSVMMSKEDLSAHNFARDMVTGKSGSSSFGKFTDLKMVVYGPISNGWSMAIVSKYNEVLMSAIMMQMLMVILAVLGLGLMYYLCDHFIRMLTKPLSDLTDSARNIATGDFNTILPEIDSEDELRDLRDAFDNMQHSLSTYMDNLKTETAARERVESELSVASHIQMSMLPLNFPYTDNLQLSAMVLPAREVGGDLYDFLIRGDKLFFTVGDVSGKGVPASMFMAIAKSAYRFISGLDIPLNEVMEKMNDSLTEGNESGLFITMFAGILDLKTGELQFCNAGHNRIVVVDPENRASFLDQKANITLGVFSGFKYEMQTVNVAKGTRLVIYTDGVTEAERADKCQYGDERLLKWAENCPENAKKACDDLLASVREFTCNNEQNDDITIMTIYYK